MGARLGDWKKPRGSSAAHQRSQEMKRLVRGAALAVLAAALVFAQAARAENRWRAYESGAFARAQKAGQTIFVAVHAHW